MPGASPRATRRFENGRFRFPCIRAGKTIVLLQPDRGSVSERKQGYHDTTTPPRHAYVALYAWLREAERIDAMIHLGTHGTLEWLPGKALALSTACFPEAVLGPVPVVYPFIVNNPGEAVQAKRRLGAVTIGHLTPPLGEAGLHGPLVDLEGLIEEYAEADGVDRRRMALLEAEILERAWRSGLARDCGLAKSDAPRVAIGKLDAQLCDIKELLIRDRLHVFGRLPDAAARADLATAINQTKQPDGAASKWDIDALIALSAERECAALVAATRRPARGARSFGRANSRAGGRSAYGAESDDDRSARHPDAHGSRDRSARRRRGREALPPGSWRLSEGFGARPVGLGFAAHGR